MIPQDYITAWSSIAPWSSQRQVEQDLIISHALVAIFSDPFLRGELRFRGGTVLNKLRALLQRNKGRDLFDLDHALTVFDGLDTSRIVECFLLYLEKSEVTISRAEAQQRMFQKLVNPAFFIDMRPLLSTDRARTLTDETLKVTFVKVMKELIDRIPGDEWTKAGEMRERFGV